jgi:hypothetical protein
METKYFALYCTTTQNYMGCGYNSKSIEELIDCYIDYDWEMEEGLTNEQVLQVIRNNYYTIDTSLTPFDSLDNESFFA